MILGQDQGKNWDGEAGQPCQCTTEKQSSKSKERAGIALSAVDLKTVPAHEIFQPPSQTSQTKHHHRQGNQPKERWKRAGIIAELTQLGPKRAQQTKTQVFVGLSSTDGENRFERN